MICSHHRRNRLFDFARLPVRRSGHEREDEYPGARPMPCAAPSPSRGPRIHPFEPDVRSVATAEVSNRGERHDTMNFMNFVPNPDIVQTRVSCPCRPLRPDPDSHGTGVSRPLRPLRANPDTFPDNGCGGRKAARVGGLSHSVHRIFRVACRRFRHLRPGKAPRIRAAAEPPQPGPLRSRAPTKALRQATTSSRSTLSFSARQRRTRSSFGISSACRMASEISSLE